MASNFRRVVTHRHWLPIVTFCPENNLPDLIYVSLKFADSPLVELYQLRKDIRKVLSWKKLYMEDIAKLLSEMYPSAYCIEVRLAFNRHVVSVYPSR